MNPLTRYCCAALLPLLLCQPLLADERCNPNVPAATPTAEFTVHGDGTVTHHRTGLMWMQCSLGQSWVENDGSYNCTGTTSAYTWQNALAQPATVNALNGDVGFAGYNDWRLPNKNELASIVERQCPAPLINLAVFPGTPSAAYWSSSPRADNPARAWLVTFLNGGVSSNAKGGSHRVRLVRAGQ